ncbi:MAG: hypothetical protein WC346_10890 [Methanogenium sp.]
MKKKGTLQVIELIKDLADKGLSRNQISKSLQMSNRQLSTFLYRHSVLGITRYNNIFPNEEQIQVIIGSLLGDGCISFSGKYSKNARLQISHCIKQKEYILFKYNKLKTLCNNGIYTRYRKDKRFKKEIYEHCELKTKSLEIFSDYRNKWYINNKKTVNISDIEKIEALGLAIWFMDDGTRERSGVSFATIGFNKPDVILLSKILKHKFNLDTKIRKDNTLYIRKRSLNDFINLIKPYIIDSMKYKIRVT